MLKGKAIIELKNVKTGEVETYNEDNLVTDAIQNILSANPIGFRDYSTGYANATQPIYSNLLGGIVLFNESLEENPSQYREIPQNNKVIGYANRSVNGTSDTFRGNFNSNESMQMEHGYKYVYDFSTTQANGSIAALALTSNVAGSYFMGNELFQKKNELKRIYQSSYTYYHSQTDPFNYEQQLNMLAHNNIRVIDNKKEIAYSIYWNGSQVVLSEIDFPLSRISLTSNNNAPRGRQRKKTQFFTLANGFSYNNAFFPDDFEHPQCIYGFSWSTSNSPTSIKWIKISLNDYSIEEETETIDLALYMAGYDYSGYYNTQYNNSSYWYSHECCLLYKNYLYCFDKNLTGIYKISIENLNDYIFMQHPEKVCHTSYNFSYSNGMGPNTTFNINNGIIYFPNGYILNDVIHHTFKVTSPSGVGYDTDYHYGLCHCHPGVAYKDFLFCFYGYCNGPTSYAYYYQGVYLQSHYLATINNLESPIEKTDDKTMKITYILTEVDEEGEE